MDSTVKVALAQVDLAVSDISGNTGKTRVCESSPTCGNLVVFPELSICSCHEDLLFHAGSGTRRGSHREIRDSVFGIAY